MQTIQTIETIGTISKGIDGTDEYLLIVDNEDAIDIDALEQELRDRYYRDTGVAGGYYCHDVRCIPDPIHDNRCIAIVYHRYDV